ncbi:MAG: tetratricopeptide repeat protein [bacterium]
MDKKVLSQILYSVSLAIIFIIIFTNNAMATPKVFDKEYTYQAGDEDSKHSSRVIALREVKRLLLEELGTYLESVTEVQNSMLTRDQITTLTAGIVQTEIVNEKWDGKVYWLKAKIEADPDSVIKSIDTLRKNRKQVAELEELKSRTNDISRENEQLRKELVTLKGEQKEKSLAIYNQNIKELSASEWLDRAAATNNSKDKIDALSKAIELDPLNASTYNKRAVALSRTNNKKQAIIDYNKAIELTPTNAQFYSNRGMSHIDLGNTSEAIRDIDKAFEICKASKMTCHYFRGLAYEKLGKKEQALADFKASAKLGDLRAKEYLKKRNIDWQQ